MVTYDLPCRTCGCYWEACDCYVVTDSVIYVDNMITVTKAGRKVYLWSCEFCEASEWLETVVDEEIRVCKVCTHTARFSY